jgi:argininosuccinate lyase
LQPLVFSMFRDARRAVKLIAAAMASAEFDSAHLDATAGKGWTTLTELADTLTRDCGMPFRVAHRICAHVMAARERDPKRSLASLVSEMTHDQCSTPPVYTDEALATILSARHFVEVRKTLGGPAPAETMRAAAAARQQLLDDRSHWAAAIAMLHDAETRLAERSASL